MQEKITFDKIVFEERNQNFGAFKIRKSYSGNVLLALIIGLVFTFSLFAVPFVTLTYFSDSQDQEIRLEVTLERLPPVEEEVKVELPPPPPPPPQPVQPKSSVKFLPPKVKPDEQVVKEEVPTVDELKESNPGSVTQEGKKDAEYIPPPPAETPKVTGREVAEWAQVMPNFPGGDEEYLQYLKENINYPLPALNNGIEGTVLVSFVVETNGKISEIKIVSNKLGFGLEEEVIRVFKTMPKWKPGKQGKQAVPVRIVKPVTFRIS